ncbi:MAG: hypothetical protein WCK06_08555 [Actinomycetota bacterium]
MGSYQRREWILALGAGLVVAVGALVVLRNVGNSPGTGPADLLGALLLLVLTVWMALPRPIVAAHRATRALGAWSAVMLFWAITETAHVCGATAINCHSSGEPLRPFIIWAVGFAALAVIWYFVVLRKR